MEVTLSEFARMAGVKPPAIFEKIKKGNLVRNSAKKLDTDNPINRLYLQRKAEKRQKRFLLEELERAAMYEKESARNADERGADWGREYANYGENGANYGENAAQSVAKGRGIGADCGDDMSRNADGNGENVAHGAENGAAVEIRNGGNAGISGDARDFQRAERGKGDKGVNDSFTPCADYGGKSGENARRAAAGRGIGAGAAFQTRGGVTADFGGGLDLSGFGGNFFSANSVGKDDMYVTIKILQAIRKINRDFTSAKDVDEWIKREKDLTLIFEKQQKIDERNGTLIERKFVEAEIFSYLETLRNAIEEWPDGNIDGLMATLDAETAENKRLAGLRYCKRTMARLLDSAAGHVIDIMNNYSRKEDEREKLADVVKEQIVEARNEG